MLNKRKAHVPRVHRKVSRNPIPYINTVEGPMHVIVTKHCNRCRTVQPINNFYFKSNRDSKKFDENDARSRRHICIPCWDELND